MADEASKVSMSQFKMNEFDAMKMLMSAHEMMFDENEWISGEMICDVGKWWWE